MNNTARSIIQAGAMGSTFAFIFFRGLQTRFSDLKYFRTRRGLLLRSLLSVDVLVPQLAMTVIVLVKPGNVIFLCAGKSAAM